MRHRLEVYHAETLKAVDYFRRQGRLVEIDGEGPVEKVSGRLLRALKRHEEGTKSAHPAYRLTKLPEEFPYLRKSGAILARVLTEVVGQVRPGITTQELNLFAEKRIRELGGLPAFKGYTHMDNPGKPFPATLCTSVNEELVHGIPGSRMVREGDIVGLDLGVNYHGYFTDMAVTIGVGAISKENEKLIEVTRRALDEGLKEIRAGVPLGNLSHRIQGVIEEAGFQVVRDLVGHGVGYAVHEPPMIPNYGRRGEGMEFMNNMVIAIEPMVTQKSHKVIFKDDGWTVEAADHLHSAHFEHTVIVTDEGYELLTKM
ncbi:MAG: type I methionyl aminopeptidase [Parcubacteria group bacterium]|nr:type I methionyl aminopeptidase [Parcubacteria group bacterium]